MRQVDNHKHHLIATFDRLVSLLFTDEELERMKGVGRDSLDIIKSRSAWIRTADLITDNVNTEKMVLIHLLWLQRLGRVVIEDIEPLAGAILVHLDFDEVVMAKRNNAAKS